MSMSKINKWIWCQYTPGAGGKMLCSMLQLSPNVHPWYNCIRENLKQFVNLKININSTTHMKKEPHAPYDISWYTRQLPFIRGDNLTTQEAENLFKERNLKYSLYLTMGWFKPYFPNWFSGRAITIINDKDSLNFLKNRRDAIFYKWKDTTVYFKRFIPRHIYNGNLIKNFKENPQIKKIFYNKDDFYKQEFYENPEVFSFLKKNNDKRVKLNINLSSFWNRSGAHLAKKINEKFDLNIDLKKADYLLDNWLKNNRKFI
jgi:hypothetical protein